MLGSRVATRAVATREQRRLAGRIQGLRLANGMRLRILTTRYADGTPPSNRPNAVPKSLDKELGRLGSDSTARREAALIRAAAAGSPPGRIMSVRVDAAAGLPSFAYFAALPRWGWIVVADTAPAAWGSHLEAVDRLAKGRFEFSMTGALLAAVTAFLLSLLLLAGYALVARSFRRFGSSFRRAAVRREPIDTKHLRFQEMRDAASRVNEIVEEHRRVSESLRASEEQLLEAQKMEAVGRLTGGIAHDFNNFLTVVMGHVELALIDPDLGEQSRSALKQIKQSARQASGLTRQLLSFSRRSVTNTALVDPNRLIADLEQMLRPILGPGIRLVVDAHADAGHIPVDETQITQVILNLVINACDAMPDGGTITLRTTTASPSELHGRSEGASGGATDGSSEGSSEAAPYAVLEVCDTGVGMDQETAKRAFEPFFSTKEAGKGTGLGLSTVSSIVKQSSGVVTVETERGRGTTFRLFFPLSDGKEQTE